MSSVYILKSSLNGEYYVGCTDNIERRIKEHAEYKAQSTKSLRPLNLLPVQTFPTLSKARKIENRIKNLKRRDYIDKIIRDGIIKMDP